MTLIKWKVVHFNHLTPSDDSLRNAFEYLEIIYIARNSAADAADSMGLCLLLFTHLFLNFKRSESKNAGRKRILTWTF